MYLSCNSFQRTENEIGIFSSKKLACRHVMNTPSHVLCTTTNDKSNKVMGINLLQIIYFPMLKIYE